VETAFGIVFFVLFFVVWGAFMLAMLGGLVLGIAALISAAQLPAEAFGPWWDNQKTPWLLGLAISYLVPFGMLVCGYYWFRTGKRGYRETGLVGRPFWSGPPKPPPQPYYVGPPAPPPPPPAEG
jgi:hypothetical protein